MADVAPVNTQVIVNVLGMAEKRGGGQRQTPKTQKPTKERSVENVKWQLRVERI